MKKLNSGIVITSTTQNPKNWQAPHVPKYSKQEIFFGIVIIICGVAVLCINTYLAQMATLKKGFLVKKINYVDVIGYVLIGLGFIAFLIGIYFRRFIKWEMKKQTGASQIAEGSNGEFIEVHEAN